MPPLRRLGRISQPQISRRSHAIPIVRPSSQASEQPTADPPNLNDYAHGVPGIPSHYIPLYGVCHGMFYDPVTNLYVGDGPPRSKPERPDGKYPCTTVPMMDAAPKPKRPTGDPMHIQSKAFIQNAIASGKDRLATNISRPATYPANSSSLIASGTAFKLYFCRCTGRWLHEPHECTEGPMNNIPIPEKVGYAPWEPLPEGWIKNRIMVDQSIYPEGKIPVTPGLPANWFHEVPVYDLVTERRLGLGPEFAAAPAGTVLPRYTQMGANPSGITPTGPARFKNLSPQGIPAAPMPPPPSKSKLNFPEPHPDYDNTPAADETNSNSKSESSTSAAPAPAPATNVNTDAGEASSSDAIASTLDVAALSMEVSEKKGKGKASKGKKVHF